MVKVRRDLLAIPAYNEAESLRRLAPKVNSVLADSACSSVTPLLVDDGSSDDTLQIALDHGFEVAIHSVNRGYGAALQTAFKHALRLGFERLITFDADGQHEPGLIPQFLQADPRIGLVSGSRYLPSSPRLSSPPSPEINRLLTRIMVGIAGIPLTDIGCGIKRIKVNLLRDLEFQTRDYAFPLEFWIRLSNLNFDFAEIPVPLLYLDPTRTLKERYGSHSRVLDLAVFTIARTLLLPPLQVTYAPGWPKRLAVHLASTRGGLPSKIDLIYRCLVEAELAGLPAREAMDNLDQLRTRAPSIL